MESLCNTKAESQCHLRHPETSGLRVNLSFTVHLRNCSIQHNLVQSVRLGFCTHVVRYAIAGAISGQLCLQGNSPCTVMVWNYSACAFSKGTLSCCTLKRFSFHSEATDACMRFSWGNSLTIFST